MSSPIPKEHSNKVSRGRKIATLWCMQLGLLAVVVLALWWFNRTMAVSVLLGGLIHWAPNAYFTLYAFRFRGAQAAVLILRSMYRGEFGKLLLTGIGFALAFVLVKPIDPLSLFVAFIGMTIYQWCLVSRW